MNRLLYALHLLVSPNSWLRGLGKLIQIIAATLATPLWAIWWLPVAMATMDFKNLEIRKKKASYLVMNWWINNAKWTGFLILSPFFLIDLLLTPLRRKTSKALVSRGIDPYTGTKISASSARGLCSYVDKERHHGTNTRDSCTS